MYSITVFVVLYVYKKIIIKKISHCFRRSDFGGKKVDFGVKYILQFSQCNPNNPFYTTYRNIAAQLWRKHNTRIKIINLKAHQRFGWDIYKCKSDVWTSLYCTFI